MKDSIIPYAIISSLSSIDNIYEMRLFGWIIAKAQSVLKLYNKDLSDINIEHAMQLTRVTLPARYLLGIGDNNYRNVKKSFTLAKKMIEYERDGIEKSLNIIAFPEYKKDGYNSIVTFVIHQELWHALLNFTKGYRLINLPTYMRLQSTYAVIMYMLVSNQKNPVTYRMDRLKQILGADQRKSYKHNGMFISKVIESAKRELDDKAPVTFDYGMDRTGLGGGYHDITITPKKNEKYVKPKGSDEKTQHLQQQRVRLPENTISYLRDAYLMTAKEMEVVENYIAQIGSESAQIQLLADILTTARRRNVQNKKGYLYEALKNEYRAASG